MWERERDVRFIHMSTFNFQKLWNLRLNSNIFAFDIFEWHFTFIEYIYGFSYGFCVRFGLSGFFCLIWRMLDAFYSFWPVQLVSYGQWLWKCIFANCKHYRRITVSHLMNSQINDGIHCSYLQLSLFHLHRQHFFLSHSLLQICLVIIRWSLNHM